MGRRLVKAAGEMGCRDYRAAAPSVGAERPDVRHSASILGIPLSLILPRSAISEPVTKPIPRSVLRVLKVVSVGRALNVICANPTRRISWITELPAPAARLKCKPRAHHPDYFFSRGSGRKSAAITGEYCLSCAEFVPTSSCDRAVVHPVSCPIGWVTRPERNCGASLVGTLSPGVAPGHPVARSIRHYH